jgi:hypothetical protein
MISPEEHLPAASQPAMSVQRLSFSKAVSKLAANHAASVPEPR